MRREKTHYGRVEDYEVKGEKVREIELQLYISERQPKNGPKRGIGWFKVTKEQIIEMEDIMKRLEPEQVLQGLRSIKNLVLKREMAKERGRGWGRPSKVDEIARVIKQQMDYQKEMEARGWKKLYKEIKLSDKSITKEAVLGLVKGGVKENIDKLLTNVSYPTKKKIMERVHAR